MPEYDRNGYRKDQPSRDELMRRRFVTQPLPLGQFSYGEFIEWAAANGTPSKPISRFDLEPRRYAIKRQSFEQRALSDEEKASFRRLTGAPREEPFG